MLNMTEINRDDFYPSWRTKAASVLVVIMSLVLFNSVALTNTAMLGLVLLASFAWRDFIQMNRSIDLDAKWFLGLVIALCAWDLVTNFLAGHSVGASVQALSHDLRTLGFVAVLWAVFMNPHVARIAFWALCTAVVLMASINLLMTLFGLQSQGEYFTTGRLGMSHMSHMYGQAVVGLVFVLAQIWVVRPSLSWRVWLPVMLLLASLFLASERRTGWVLFVVALGVWGWLNLNKLLLGKYKLLLLCTVFSALSLAIGSDVLHRRMTLAFAEFNQFLTMTPQERSAAMLGSVSIRMQYAITFIEVIKHSNWWVGVGSLNLPQAYQAAAVSVGVSPQAWATYNWSNPHNEYLYMLATKGVVGLTLYVAIFAQACRLAWSKTDEIQRIGLLIFIFLFMLSITTNSMMVDMVEGHFTMLILLIFLAPKSLDLIAQNRISKL
jgi:hypothetical protein